MVNLLDFVDNVINGIGNANSVTIKRLLYLDLIFVILKILIITTTVMEKILILA